MEPDTTKSRFASLSENDATNLLLSKDALNTKRANERTHRTFCTYLKEKNYGDVDFENWRPDMLDETLSKFYSEARTETGELYKTTSFYSLRYSLNRHLADFAIRNKKDVMDITSKIKFPKSNEMFKACCKMLKKEGKGFVESSPPIEEIDLQKMAKYFESNLRENPKVMQQKVFVDLMLHFGRRGRENLRDLKQSDFAVSTDGEGELYLHSVQDEQTKNHQEDLHRNQGRMYEVKGKKISFALH